MNETYHSDISQWSHPLIKSHSEQNASEQLSQKVISPHLSHENSSHLSHCNIVSQSSCIQPRHDLQVFRHCSSSGSPFDTNEQSVSAQEQVQEHSPHKSAEHFLQVYGPFPNPLHFLLIPHNLAHSEHGEVATSAESYRISII